MTFRHTTQSKPGQASFIAWRYISVGVCLLNVSANMSGYIGLVCLRTVRSEVKNVLARTGKETIVVKSVAAILELAWRR
jgi:hypothetical protein